MDKRNFAVQVVLKKPLDERMPSREEMDLVWQYAQDMLEEILKSEG